MEFPKILVVLLKMLAMLLVVLLVLIGGWGAVWSLHVISTVPWALLASFVTLGIGLLLMGGSMVRKQATDTGSTPTPPTPPGA